MSNYSSSEECDIVFTKEYIFKNYKDIKVKIDNILKY